MSRRSNPVVERLPDGSYRLVLAPAGRAAVGSLLGELEELLELAPDDHSLHRLHPPAYLDDPERDLGYQLLAGDELRTKRRATIEAVRATLERDELSEAELWSWLQALNALRLVVGTRLGIDDDHDGGPDDLDDLDESSAEHALWQVFDFTTDVQSFVVSALEQ